MSGLMVQIVESPSLRDQATNEMRGRALKQVLDFARIDSEHSVAYYSSDLGPALLRFIDRAGKNPTGTNVLHLCCHGVHDGLCFTSATTTPGLDWHQLALVLSAINFQVSGVMILVLDTCFGGCGKVMAEYSVDVFPFQFMIGTQQPLSYPDAVIGFSSFYHLLHKFNDFAIAIGGMRTSTGALHLEAYDGKTLYQAAEHKRAVEQLVKKLGF